MGIGLKTESDSLEAQLFDEDSKKIAEGPLAINKLKPGKYLLVVRCGGLPVQYRPVLLGNRGSREGVPQDIVDKYKKEASK